MFNKKLIILLMVTLLAMTLVAGCSGDKAPEGDVADNGAEEQLVIGFSQVTLDSPFYVALMEAAEAKADEMGAKLVYVDAQNDIAKQNKDVQDLITRGIDILLLNAVNPSGVAPAIKAAEEAGIPVIAVDRPAQGEVATFVGRDNKAMGKLAGELAVDLLGGVGAAEGKVIEIQGAAGGQVMMDRRDGFHEPLEQEAGVEIVQSPYADYVRANAVTAFQDLLQANPDVNLVYAHNDDMALGAYQVLEQNDMLGDVKIIGVDGLMEAIQKMETGNYHGTVLNDPGYLGEVAVETALGVLDGEEYPEFVDAGTSLITPDNAADYINPDLVFASKQ
ncbi:substrate-binding domain-containing protein [Metallumcola ferriviriculae]|uniref:Substrate-binding domain-containing protein n=1 Tax=Metallumcola ferriviriculae TaxID=3039180 RepID=A0AAU0UQS9_9FIRM|nr:substrate-binding domain-containing protein [Desulfitibacteraceae bacterium MK1]